MPDRQQIIGARLDARPVARLHHVADTRVRMDPLAAIIRARRSTKEPFDSQARVPAGLLDRIAALAGSSVTIDYANKGQRVGAIARTIIGAVGIAVRTPRTNRESTSLIRIGADAIDAAPDGIALRGRPVEALLLAGKSNARDLADQGSTASRQGLERQFEIYGSVPAALWLVTPGNRRLDQFGAGRTYVPINLLPTALGLKMHPASQSLEEYPERARQLGRIHPLLRVPEGQRVQMLARIGYGPEVPPTPRWPLGRHLQA